MSTWLETALLNHVFGGPDYVPPTAFYAALFTAPPTADGGGTEVTGGNYTRLPVTFSAPAGSPPTINNPAPLEWSAASTDWGIVTSGGVYDALAGGNFLGFGNLVSAVDGVTPAQIPIAAGQIFRLPPGGLVVGFTVTPPTPVAFTPTPTQQPRLSMRLVAGEVIDGAGIVRQALVIPRRGAAP
jgi:hypothetical protein